MWTNARTDVGRRIGYDFGGFGIEIYGVRLDATWNLIDTTPFIVSEQIGQQENPLVVGNGQNWLVAWHSQASTAYYKTTQVLAARVSPQGKAAP